MAQGTVAGNGNESWIDPARRHGHSGGMESIAREIVRRLQKAGHVALYAGGCVRDELRGVVPADYDIATDAAPDAVRALFPRTLEVGAHFGVICVIEKGRVFQVATFRSDGAYRDGRHPESVRFTTAEEDARRRDFTVNGLFKDPITGGILDYVGGREDLKARVLRAIGDPVDRFREDGLRLLRAVRFATVLGFGIEPGTWEALCAGVDGIGRVSPERIREELVRLLRVRDRARGLDLLDGCGLLARLLPEVAALKGCEQPPEFHPEGDVFVHTRIMLDLLDADPPDTLVWATLLHDIGKPPCGTVDENGRIRFNGHDRVGARMAEVVMERLKFSRAETEAVVEMVDRHMGFKDVKNMRVATLKRFMARPWFDQELELHRVDCQSSHGLLDNLEYLKCKREEFASEPLIPPPLVTGRDLIDRGMKPGPAFKEILTTAQTMQLEGKFATREQALAWMDGLKTV